MNATIKKWGNSLALRIPKPLAQQVHLGEGDGVELHARENGLLVRPVRRRYRLADLVKRMNAANRHKETDWGKAAGEELW